MIKVPIKKVSYGLLASIGVQAIAVGIGIHHYYTSSREINFIGKPISFQYYLDDVRYAVITNSRHNYSTNPLQGETKEFKIHFASVTTGTVSGDSAIITIPV